MQRLTFYERQIIEAKVRQGKSHRAIARHLKRDHRVIDREVGRNCGDHSPYTAETAQRISEQHERKRTRKKMEKDQILRHYVVAELKEDHSPEQIAGRLKEQPLLSGLPGKRVCLETIYQYIYAGEGRWENLYPHLRRGQHKRQHQRARKRQSGHIPERISIHERPVEVKRKTRYGHWESDTVVCSKQKNALSVQYERKAELARIHKVADRSAPETTSAIRDTIASLPQDFFLSFTFDNGLEAVEHTKLRDDYGLRTFFCDAYASWQKGGVENLNGLIRQYVPRYALLDQMTDDEIYAIQEKLNNRQRKSLHYLTPNEVIAREVGH